MLTMTTEYVNQRDTLALCVGRLVIHQTRGRRRFR